MTTRAAPAAPEDSRVCEMCSGPLQRRYRENSKQWRERRFCGRKCFARHFAQRTPAPTDPSIYANYVADPATGCWVWRGYCDRNGYGRVYDPNRPRGKRTDWVHRVFYERFNAPIPPKHEVDHVCGNTVCVNPEHLEAVTKVEHARRTFDRLGVNDRHRLAAEMRCRGLTYAEIAEALEYSDRASAAEAIRRAVAKGLVDPDALPETPRLTEAERVDIRALYAVGVPQTDLAAWYGVDSSHVSRVCGGTTSGHMRLATDGEATA
jgi:hypothetical protein